MQPKARSINLHRRFVNIPFPADVHEAFRVRCDAAGVSMSSAVEALVFSVVEERVILRRQPATLIVPRGTSRKPVEVPAEPDRRRRLAFDQAREARRQAAKEGTQDAA